MYKKLSFCPLKIILVSYDTRNRLLSNTMQDMFNLRWARKKFTKNKRNNKLK